jgi:hypothetical protein
MIQHRYETKGDVKTPECYVWECIVRGWNIWGRNVRGHIIPVPNVDTVWFFQNKMKIRMVLEPSIRTPKADLKLKGRVYSFYV